MNNLCPTCGRVAEYLVINAQDGSEFCPGCAPPSFLPNYILTVSDIVFMKACGVDPQIPPVLQEIFDRATGAKTG